MIAPKVGRYRWHHGEPSMWCTYVSASDYDALEAKFKEACELLKESWTFTPEQRERFAKEQVVIEQNELYRRVMAFLARCET